MWNPQRQVKHSHPRRLVGKNSNPTMLSWNMSHPTSQVKAKIGPSTPNAKTCTIKAWLQKIAPETSDDKGLPIILRPYFVPINVSFGTTAKKMKGALQTRLSATLSCQYLLNSARSTFIFGPKICAASSLTKIFVGVFAS